MVKQHIADTIASVYIIKSHNQITNEIMLIFPPFWVILPAVPLDVTSEQIDYFPHPCVHSCRAL